MPKIKSKQIVVSTPHLPGDIIDKQYLESVLVVADAPSLSTEISTEISTRLSIDNSLSTQISTQISNSISNNSELINLISTEESLRLTNYVTLSTNILYEQSIRLSKDNSLSTSLLNNVTTESSVRLSIDNSLSTALSNTISSEQSIRLSIDNSLSTILSIETLNRINNDNFIIDKNDISVSSGVSYINFIGEGVRVKKSSSGITTGVNVYIPSSYTISHFNTQDSLSNSSLIPLFTTTSRYVSVPTSEGNPFKIGNWYPDAREIVDTIRIIDDVIYQSNDYFSVYDTNTTLKTIIYDANGITELVSFQIILSGITNITQNNIKYEVTDWLSDVDRYKSKVKITINIQNIIPNGGRFSVKITHNNGIDGTYHFIKNDIFRDAEISLMSVNTNVTLTSVDTNTIKTLSGIKYLTNGSLLDINISGINYLNSCSYPTTPQITIIGTHTSTGIIEVNGEGNINSGTTYETFDLGTWNRRYNLTGVIFTKNDWLISNINESNWEWGSAPNYLDHVKNTYMTVSYYDWGHVDDIVSDNMLILIDTFVDSSNRNIEQFRTENYRLKSNMSSWDSTQDLMVYDGGRGLQVLSDRLVYPRYNFTIYNTPYIRQFDYDQSQFDRCYYRKFETDGKTSSNGIIEFSDYYENFGQYFIDGKVKISLSIDSGVSWFNLNSEYKGGRLVNDSGCRIDSVDYSINNGKIQTNAMRFTLGQNGTSKYIIMRIIYTEDAFLMYLGGIQIKDNYWD